MKLRKLLPIILFSTLALAGCGGAPEGGGGGVDPKPFPAEHNDPNYVVELTNYETIASSWAVQQQMRFEISLKANGVEKDPVAEIMKENLEFFTEEEDAFSFQGVYATAGKTVGTYKIALKYYETVKHYSFTLIPSVPEPEVITGQNVSSIKNLSSTTKNTVIYEVNGVVSEIGTEDELTKDGLMYIADPEVPADRLYVYASRADDGEHDFKWISKDGDGYYDMDAFRKQTPENVLTSDMTKDLKRGDLVRAYVLYESNYKNYYALIKEVTVGEFVPATSLTFDQESLEIEKGKTATLKLTIEPKECNYKAVWSSEDESIATVTKGRVVGKAIGTTKIKATVGEMFIECPVEVTENQSGYIDAVITAGTNATECTVNENPGLKVGKSGTGNGGNMTIAVEGAATEVVFYAAAWNNTGTGKNITVSTSVGEVDKSTITIIQDSGIKNSTPFTLASSDVEQFFVSVKLTGITDGATITVASGTAQRFVIWGVQYK